jgi:hypothetical protein
MLHNFNAFMILLLPWSSLVRYRRSYAIASCGVPDVNRLENLLVPHVYGLLFFACISSSRSILGIMNRLAPRNFAVYSFAAVQTLRCAL